MAFLFKRGNVWYVQYKRNDKNERVSCKTRSKKIAEEVLKRYQYAEAEGNYDFLEKSRKKKTPVTLGEFYQRHISHAEKTISPKWLYDKSNFFRSHLLPYFGENTPLESITTSKVEAYRLKRLKKVSPRTVNLEVVCLMTLLRQAIEWGELNIQHLPRIKKLKEPQHRLRFLTNHEIPPLLEAAAKISGDLETYVLLLLYSGLRSGEALALRWVDVNFERNHLEIASHEGWKTKTRSNRFVPMPETLSDHLRARRERYPDVKLVVAASGNHGNDRIKRIFTKAVQLADLPVDGEDKVTAHTLRHTYASHLVMKGTPLYTVSALLGHTDSKTTQIYAHLAPDHLQDAVSKVSY